MGKEPKLQIRIWKVEYEADKWRYELQMRNLAESAPEWGLVVSCPILENELVSTEIVEETVKCLRFGARML